MRIAAISDIHGDLRALEAVWRDIEQRGLNDHPVLNAGDTVAYGTENAECIDFVRNPSRKIISVGGNYDYNVAKFPKKEDDFRKKWGKLRPEKFEAIAEASKEIDSDQREWLKELPPMRVVEIAGVFFSISHYAPNQRKLGLHSMTTDDVLADIVDHLDNRISVLLVGHTHSRFVRRAGSVLIVNPGAVGRTGGAPTYAEITIEPGEFPTARIHQCRVTL